MESTVWRMFEGMMENPTVDWFSCPTTHLSSQRAGCCHQVLLMVQVLLTTETLICMIERKTFICDCQAVLLLKREMFYV